MASLAYSHTAGAQGQGTSSPAAAALHILLKGLLEVCSPQQTLAECMEQQLGLGHGHTSEAIGPMAMRATPDAGMLPEQPATCRLPAQPMPIDISSQAAWAGRAVVALVLVTLLSLAGLAYYHIDHAPPWLVRYVVKALKLHTHAEQQPSGMDVPLSRLLTYHLDKQLSSTPSFKIWTLGLVTAVLIAVGCLALFAAGEDSLYEAFWLAVAGAGLDWTFSNKAQGDHWGALLMRTVSLLLSIGGMLITALLLGLVSEGISNKVDDLRKGRASVLERDHVLIIGFSEKIYCLLQELAMGKATVGGRPIVILAERDKEMMEDAISANNLDMLGSTISCRTGDPLMRSELLKVSAQHASSIIILANDANPHQSDAALIRVVLSLMVMHIELRNSGRGGLKGHIVAEACNRDHRDLLLHLGYARMLTTVVPYDLSARMMVQCARHPQVQAALTELVGFAGSEFYIQHNLPSKFYGLAFGQLQKLFPLAVPIGIKKESGAVMLRPLADYAVEKGDALVLLATDETCLEPNKARLNAAAAELYMAATSYGLSNDFLTNRRDIASLDQASSTLFFPGGSSNTSDRFSHLGPRPSSSFTLQRPQPAQISDAGTQLGGPFRGGSCQVQDSGSGGGSSTDGSTGGGGGYGGGFVARRLRALAAAAKARLAFRTARQPDQLLSSGRQRTSATAGAPKGGLRERLLPGDEAISGDSGGVGIATSTQVGDVLGVSSSVLLRQGGMGAACGMMGRGGSRALPGDVSDAEVDEPISPIGIQHHTRNRFGLSNGAAPGGVGRSAGGLQQDGLEAGDGTVSDAKAERLQQSKRQLPGLEEDDPDEPWLA